MPISDFKSIEAIHNGKTVRGIYCREAGTFEARKGAVKIIVPEYEYSFDFTVGGKRYRSVFGKESDYGKVGATGKWESCAIENAVEALMRFRTNAINGEGATSIKEELGLVRNVAEEKKRQQKREKTVEDLVKLFLTDIAVSSPGIKTNKPRTIKEYSLNLHRDVVPAIGKRKAKDIEREDISEIIEKIVKRGKIVQANRTLSACSRLFNWALSKGRVRYNPCAQMRKYNEKPRERVLTEPEQKEASEDKARHDEIKSLWHKLLENSEFSEARILMLCILTGARPGEVCRMKWEDIDDKDWWSVHKDEIKTEVELESYLTATATTILGKKKKKGYVFPLASDKDRPLPVDRLSRYVRDNSYLGLPNWQPRDLRRTFTTLSKGFGFSDLIINKAQARKDASVIRTHYDKRRYYNELRKLFETVEREILRIIEQPSESAKIIQLRT
jgi:integrase